MNDRLCGVLRFSVFLVLLGGPLVASPFTDPGQDLQEDASQVESSDSDSGADAAEEPGTEGEDIEESEPLDNRLKWSTASEIDNFGYHVYRGDSEEGPFERMTDDPMAGAGTTDEPSYYEFVDDQIDPTRDYFYYVESLAMDGTRERFTPVIRAKAKQPLEDTAEEMSDEESPAEDGDEMSSEGEIPPSG